MKLSTSLVAVKKIASAVPCSQFSEDDLTRTAQLILEAEGVINPIILQRKNLESYEVVAGDFEYYAAVKAREIDPRKGEMIGAFIMEPENEKALQEQVKVLRQAQGKPEIEEKLANITNTLTQVLTSVKNIENDLQPKQKRSQPETASKNTQTKTSEKSGYDSMTVAQLRDKAKQQNLKVTTKMNKTQLITALSNAEKS